MVVIRIDERPFLFCLKHYPKVVCYFGDSVIKGHTSHWHLSCLWQAYNQWVSVNHVAGDSMYGRKHQTASFWPQVESCPVMCLLKRVFYDCLPFPPFITDGIIMCLCICAYTYVSVCTHASIQIMGVGKLYHLWVYFSVLWVKGIGSESQEIARKE